MIIDEFGVASFESDELVTLLYKNPDVDLQKIQCSNPDQYNEAVKEFFLDMTLLDKYQKSSAISVDEFDAENQRLWFMPEEYKLFDIATHVLTKCDNNEQLQRVGKELLMFQERGLFPVLQYMKYLVDTLRENNVVWGLGRGSSVSSYVLFLIGVHKIDSIYYDLEIEEFLR